MQPLVKIESMWKIKRPIKERIKLVQDQAYNVSGKHISHKEAKKLVQDMMQATHYKNDKYQVYVARVVDTANQYHMFVFGKGHGIPLGFMKGFKSEKEYNNNGMVSKQRKLT